MGIENFTTEPAPALDPPAPEPKVTADEGAASDAKEATPAQTQPAANIGTPEPPAATPAPPVRGEPLRPGGPLSAETPALDDGMRRVQVLGKIELKTEPAEAPASADRPGPAADAPPATDGRRKKGKKVIRRGSQMDPFMGGDRLRGRRPQKRRATPGKEQQATQITVP